MKAYWRGLLHLSKAYCAILCLSPNEDNLLHERFDGLCSPIFVILSLYNPCFFEIAWNLLSRVFEIIQRLNRVTIRLCVTCGSSASCQYLFDHKIVQSAISNVDRSHILHLIEESLSFLFMKNCKHPPGRIRSLNHSTVRHRSITRHFLTLYRLLKNLYRHMS